jgi:transcriptional regulator with XRE-family HTH domain
MPRGRERRAAPALPPRSLRERINRLFEVHRPPGSPEREYRNKEVVAACRAQGRDISESHLSELRRGLKDNPTMRTLETIAWFFQVRVGYFLDPDTAAEVELELAAREARLAETIESNRKAQAELADAARELQQAIRTSGVTKMAHRGLGGETDSRERAAMMRALTRLILHDEDEDGQGDGEGRGDTQR